MSIYKRYFRITEGPLVAEIDRLFELRNAASKLYNELRDKHQAKEVRNYSHTGAFAGFIFKEDPDTGVYRFLKKHKLWVPRRTGPGKEIWKGIESLPQPEPIDSALKLAGLTPNVPCLFGSGRWYAPTLWGFGEPQNVWFISVPWKDVDPAELAQYKLDREAGTCCDSNLEHLSWEAPLGWTEVKEWQISKESDEINASIKAT